MCDVLLSGGHRVRALDNFTTGSLDNVPEDIDLMVGDVRDLKTCRAACAGAKYVFHLAAMTSVPESMQKPGEFFDVNIGGLTNMLHAAAEANVTRLVFSSSAAVYGLNSSGTVSEETPAAPISIYGLTKLQGEQLCQFFSAHYLLDTISLRYFNVYGPRQRADSAYAAVVPKFLQAVDKGLRPIIFGDGEQSRDFCNVRDVARANLLAAIAKGDQRGTVINIGTGLASSLNDLLYMITDASGSRLNPVHEEARAGDISFSCADIRRAQSVLGYRPQITLEAGLRAMLERTKEVGEQCR